MELRLWKALLLQWIQKCNFISNVICLEDTDIEEFFKHYAQFLNIQQPAARPASSPMSSFPFSPGKLLAFLNDTYPNFKPLLERNGRIMTTDFAYVYTLLMHYTCIQKPNEHFHNICRSLPDLTQQYFAAFFTQIIRNSNMSRCHLRETIANISDIVASNDADSSPTQPSRSCITFLSVGPTSDLNNSDVKSSDIDSNNKDSAAIDNDSTASTNFATPTPVQRELTSLLNVSPYQAPSTPKTVLLEQRTRELIGLRAQLETERYEKTVLEDQIMENEQLINSLSKENTVKKQQLAKLAASLEFESDETNFLQCIMPNEIESLKRQLLKEINKKEAVLAESRDEMQELKSSYDALAEKHQLSEQQVHVCMGQIDDLERRLETATQNLVTKDAEIACLLRDKSELEQCLQEARTELQNGREVLNASSDLLETSQSTASMNTTPETLACSVIDKQLREKELENDDLRDQMQNIVKEKKSILHELLMIVQPYQPNMSPSQDTPQLLALVERSLIELSDRYEQEHKRVQELLDQCCAVQQRNRQDNEVIQVKQENTIQDLDEEVIQVKQENTGINLDEEVIQMQQENTGIILDEEVIQMQQKSTVENLDEQDQLILEKTYNDIKNEMARIKAELARKDAKLAKLGIALIKFSSLHHILNEQLATDKAKWKRRDDIEALELRIFAQDEIITDQEQQLIDTHKEVTTTKRQLIETEEQLNYAEQKLTDSQQQISDTHKQLTDTEELLTEADQQLSNTRKQLIITEQQLIDTQQYLSDTEQQLNDTQQHLSDTEQHLNHTHQHLKDTEEQLSVTIHQLNDIQEHVQGFIQTVNARFNLEPSSESIDEIDLEEVEKLLIRWQDAMNNQVKQMESDIVEKTTEMTAVDRITSDILRTLNPYLKPSIDDVNTDALSMKLQFLYNQLSQLVAKYESLTEKCQVLDRNIVQSVEVRKQENSALQKEHNETIMNLTGKLSRLEMQCDKLTKELQQKSAECEEINKKLLTQKDLNSANNNNDIIKTNGDLNISSIEQLSEMKATIKAVTVQNGNNTENQCQDHELELTNIKNKLQAANEKQAQLKQELEEKMALFQQSDIAIQTLQQEIVEQTQEVEKANSERKYSQLNLELAQQQLEKASEKLLEQESVVTRFNELQNVLKGEQHKNLLLEQEQIKQIEQKRIIDRKLGAIQCLLVKREDELQKSKTQLETTTKRLEKIAVKLGEQQAILSKTQREMAQAKLKQTEQAELITALQNEKENLQTELRKNKDRANRSEEKVATLEHQRVMAESERDAHRDQLMRFERESKKAQNTIRDLQQQAKVIENEKQNLVLEIGGLNSEIVQQKKLIVELNLELKEIKDKLRDLELINENNAAVTAEQEIKEQPQIVKLQSDLVDAHQELEELRGMRDRIQHELTNKIQELESERGKAKDRESLYQRKMLALNDKLIKCNEELVEIRTNHDKLLETLEKDAIRYTNELQEVHEELEDERSKVHQRDLDCQILQAKYRDSKDEISLCEQKLKDQRLELEGKLEKMKSKMRTLYTTEVSRIKEKQERDMAKNKLEVEKLNVQIKKYEEHTRKLSNQIVRLNEKLLEEQKKHAILNTQLRHLQEAEKATTAMAAAEDWQPFKRPNAPSANLGSNLAMEDEEGEVFNNTYLTDLKLGTVPNMTTEELQYRNSLQPPHLKSAYAAQYDLGVQEDDIKDGPHSLDDSMSALLSTTDGNGLGTRKKSMGTHYKRPGPPTPSKNGGRLSFGGSEPPREILRETYDNNGTAKTPARFKLFASRFSIGSTGGGGGQCLPRDENSPPKRRLSNMFKRK